jgi:adenosine deaminase
MRHLPPSETARAAALAARWAGRGVVAFDLAGAEHGHPPGEHQEAIAIARAAGLGLTLHAGEADEALRVVEAARLGATRVGHGVRLVDALHDPSQAWMVDKVRAFDLHLEVCPTSNVHTGAAPSIAAHPIGALWRAGLSVGFNTDNRLMSRISLESEAEVLLAEVGFGVGDLVGMGLEAARHSFLGAAAREQAARALRNWARTHDVETKTPQS